MLADQLEPVMRAIFDGGEPVYGIPVAGRNERTGETRSTEASFFGLDDRTGRRMALGCVVVDTTQRERAAGTRRVAAGRDHERDGRGRRGHGRSTRSSRARSRRSTRRAPASRSPLTTASSSSSRSRARSARRCGTVSPASPSPSPRRRASRTPEGRSIWLPTPRTLERRVPRGREPGRARTHAAFLAPWKGRSRAVASASSASSSTTRHASDDDLAS